MSIFDEIYYQTHELTLHEEYEDYLIENNLNRNNFTFKDFIDIF